MNYRFFWGISVQWNVRWKGFYHTFIQGVYSVVTPEGPYLHLLQLLSLILGQTCDCRIAALGHVI